MISQGLAREHGPKGSHRAHILIDGGINGERLRTLRRTPRPNAGEGGLLEIDVIAEA